MGTELPEQFRELGHILHCGTVCPDHPELLVKDPCGDELGFGQQAGLLKHGEKPCMAGFVQIDGFTADGRVRLGQSAPFSPCAGTLFLVVHIYVFYVVQFHRWHCRRLFLPHNLRLQGANCSPLQGASGFCCKTEWCCKKHSLLCSGEHKSFPLRRGKSAFGGKRGLTTDEGKQPTSGWMPQS